MGFDSVYRVLQEIFPEVDARLLRAVAVEHSKDTDAAVGVVVTEVFPFIAETSTATSSSGESGIMLNPSEAVRDADTTTQTDEENGLPFDDANCGHDQVGNRNDESIPSKKCEESSENFGADLSSHVTSIALVHENGARDHHNELEENTKSEEINTIRVKGLLDQPLCSLVFYQSSLAGSATLKRVDNDSNGSMNSHLHTDMDDLDEPVGCNSNPAIEAQSDEEHSYIDGKILEENSSVFQVDLSRAQDCMPSAPESSLPFVVVPELLIADVEKSEPSDSLNSASSGSSVEVVDLEDDSTLKSIITRSGQTISIDLLEDVIEDARSNKKTLFTAMESVISLMREVELQEKAAEQAKEEAAKGGFDILTSVEDLKEMLQHAKKANDMHAGEVYGEKSILATEVRELQSRLISLSDERDNSLAILDAMRQTLEVRLAEAEKMKKAAEQDMLEKQEVARKALADQELIMEKVVQESKILKEEAEKNSKLREFLMDRGCVVDMLQGEISVICQDVKLLKEKFDERLPFSKSISSSQTSCILASLRSSLKSVVPDHVSEQADSSATTPKESSLLPSDDDKPFSGDERGKVDRQALVEEGWEFFDNNEFSK